MDDDIPYLLLTPGPLTTSRGVRRAMLHDYSTWDVDYNAMVNDIRTRLVRLATARDGYTSVLMQGSGTFGIEATIGSVVAPGGKILIVNNGAYGKRMVDVARRLRIDCIEIEQPETEPADLNRIESALASDPKITHVAAVHCETTTGMLNPACEIGEIVARHHRIFILDAMSSFGGIPMTMEETQAHFLVSSANKCIQGVPGFSFVVAERSRLEQTKGTARSLSLDLFDQWREMEENNGKWRYTSPTHTVCAFSQALIELEEEGGIEVRHRRYHDNQKKLVVGMRDIGFRTLLPDELQSPFITSFYYPDDDRFEFSTFYDLMKARRFVLYPGKVSSADTFRIGTIGHVFADDIELLLNSVAAVVDEMGLRLHTDKR